MKSAVSCGVAFGLGAGAMYLLDPSRGRWRRHVLRDKAKSKARHVGRAAEHWWKDLGNRAYGTLLALASRFENRDAADEVLEARVRAKLGRVTSHPHALAVKAERGRITLRGPILAREVPAVIAGAGSVPGVHEVDNQLEVHARAEGVPALQGGVNGSRGHGGIFQFTKEHAMITRNITLPELGLIAGTRAVLGAGIALLLADRLNPEQRKAVGWTLVGVGVLTTFPLAAGVIFGNGGTGRGEAKERGGSGRRVMEREGVTIPG